MSEVHLNRELVLETPVETPDGAGGTQSGWEELGRLWADLRPGTGRDVGGAAHVWSSAGYRILVRAAPVGSDARPVVGQRFREGERIWRIVSVTEDDRFGHYLRCFTKEEVLT